MGYWEKGRKKWALIAHKENYMSDVKAQGWVIYPTDDETVGFLSKNRNILDNHYRTYSSGISAPGRNVVLSIRANI